MSTCCGGRGNGDGQKPADCMAGPRETIMYVSCLQPVHEEGKNGKSDYLATIDINPASSNFCKVISRLYMPNQGDELHHFAWNACVSCPNTPRKYLVVPGFFSGNIHIIDATTDPLNPTLFKIVDGAQIAEKFDVTYPHTVHCIPSGDVMIHTLGDKSGNGKGAFYLLDGQTFEPKELWNTGKEDIMGHDYWYQPRHNIMISTEFGAPRKFTKGFDPADLAKGDYGTKIHLWNWAERTLFETVDIGMENAIPMEIRFLHDPDATDAYIVTAVGASIMHVSHKTAKQENDVVAAHRVPTSGTFEIRKYLSRGKRFFVELTQQNRAEFEILVKVLRLQYEYRELRLETGKGPLQNAPYRRIEKWKAVRVAAIPPKKVKNWILPAMPALITDLVISLDDKYMFLSCYLHGDVRQYDITDRKKPKMISQVFLGGSVCSDGDVMVQADEELAQQPERASVKGRKLYGGPHMVQLSRDGKRLYVTNSIITPWDKQFYPDMAPKGGVMVMLDVTPDGMTLNQDFLVDFGKEPDGPCRGHEMRYPGGDCTSDIWI